LAATRTTAACNDDALKLIPNLRASDLSEMRAFGIDPTETALLNLAESDEAWTVWYGDEVMAMYGVLSPDGLVWLLTSTLMDDHKVVAYRTSRRALQDLKSRHDKLCCVVEHCYERSARWLRRLGFSTRGEGGSYTFMELEDKS
jgi:hypothetical protein